MTGYGVFASYLYRIGKVDSPMCGYCKQEEDTAEHTLARYQEWSDQRGDLMHVLRIGDTQEELSLKEIVAKGVESKALWTAFRMFASLVRNKS